MSVSIPFARDEDARAIEPFASPPSKRFETLRVLANAGLEVAVAVAPIIPGLNDAQIPEILRRAADAGATSAFKVMLRLPLETAPIFEARLAESFPFRRAKVMNAIEETRGGRQNDSRFGSRMVGQGPRWEATERLFATQCRRLGLRYGADERPPVRPVSETAGSPQLSLGF